jgi:hypothetical protein
MSAGMESSLGHEGVVENVWGDGDLTVFGMCWNPKLVEPFPAAQNAADAMLQQATPLHPATPSDGNSGPAVAAEQASALPPTTPESLSLPMAEFLVGRGLKEDAASATAAYLLVEFEAEVGLDLAALDEADIVKTAEVQGLKKVRNLIKSLKRLDI